MATEKLQDTCCKLQGRWKSIQQVEDIEKLGRSRVSLRGRSLLIRNPQPGHAHGEEQFCEGNPISREQKLPPISDAAREHHTKDDARSSAAVEGGQEGEDISLLVGSGDLNHYR